MKSSSPHRTQPASVASAPFDTARQCMTSNSTVSKQAEPTADPSRKGDVQHHDNYSHAAVIGLVDANGLREAIWPMPDCRPSLRTIREWQSKRLLPVVKIGRLVYFDVAKCRQALANKFTVEAR